MKELQRHRDAFEQYFIQKQNDKSIEEAISTLVGDLGVTRKTLYKWKKEFKWDDREAVRAADIQKEVSSKTDSTIVDNRVWYLGFYHDLLRDLKNGTLKIENVNDLDKVVKGALLLQGESTDRTERKDGGLDGLAESIRKSLETVTED